MAQKPNKIEQEHRINIHQSQNNAPFIQNNRYEVQTIDLQWIFKNEEHRGRSMHIYTTIGSTLFTRDQFETGMVRFHIGSPSYVDPLVPDSRSKPNQICQVSCKHKVYPYQFRNGSKWIWSHVNAALRLLFTLRFLCMGNVQWAKFKGMITITRVAGLL